MSEKEQKRQDHYKRREAIMVEQQALIKELQPHLELEYRVEGDQPLLVLLVGDLHIGHAATDYEELKKLRDFLLNEEEMVVGLDEEGEPITVKTDNIKIIFLGDEIEGVKSKYLTTNIMGLTMDMQEQLNYFRDQILKPLADAGKVIGMVSHYWGHPGWAHESTTMDPWAMLADACDVETVLNGGQVNFVFEDGQTSSVEVRHNPKGKSMYDPLYGARNGLLKKSEPARADGSAAAHTHQQGVGKEHHAGSNYPFYMVSSGTIKSVNTDLPVDQFGVRLGSPYSTGKGMTSVLITRPTGRYKKRNPDIVHTPLPTLRHADVAQRGLGLLNETERQGITREVKEEILDHFGEEPNIEWSITGSAETNEEMEGVPKGKALERLRKNGFSKSDLEREKVFSKLRFNIETELPVLLQFISNARIGSHEQADGFGRVNKFQRDYVINNPHAVVLYLRNLMDAATGKLENRRDVLDKIARLISRAGDKGLALLLDSNLRDDQWKRGDDPIPPGSYLSRKADIPLMHHLSKVELAVGPNADHPYTFSVLDKLGNHGSFSRPTFGLRRNYDLYMHDKPGTVVGGHMQNSGTMMFYDKFNPETNHPALIAPGWWAKSVDTMGKGNVSQGAEPGQAAILFPQTEASDYLMYPTSNIEESNLLFDAFMLLVGLEKLGLLEKVEGNKS